MKEPKEHSEQRKKENRQTAIALLILLAFVVVGVFGFLRFYNRTTDKTLYEERLSQMQEVTTQLFSGLEDVVKTAWRTVDEKSAALQLEKPNTLDTLLAFMGKQATLARFDDIRCNLVAVDAGGWYYNQSGRHGMLTEREFLNNTPETLSFVSNNMTNDETRMVFLKRLETPIVVRDGSDTIAITYFGLAQDMKELNPYFECKAYKGANSVYVVDSTGLKLFSSSSSEGDLLKGYNVYNTLREMRYLHNSSFEDAFAELQENGISYSNAVLNGTELYYALYKMDSSAWTLIFMVPSAYVATNTVELVNDTVRLVLIFAVALILVSAAAIYWLGRQQQKKAVAVERQYSSQLERALKKAEKAEQKAKNASKAKSEFLANMSHDIRTPMNAIVGITGLMEHEGSLSDKEHSYLRKIQMSSRHLLSLINDVLDMSKIESGDVVLDRGSTSLAEEVQQVETIIRPQAEEHGHSFIIRVHELRHEYLILDSVRLRQVLINLLSNAVKYTPNGGKIVLDIAQLPCQQENHATIRISVTDNGIGMSQEYLEHIFEPFTRSENSVTNKVQGTGLGMAITKSIVDMGRGTIEVQSQLDKGSRFDVTLTWDIDESAERTVNAKGVLLIGQEEILRRNVSASMEQADVLFRAVANPSEAVPLLESGEFDVVLLSGFLKNAALSEMVQTLRNAAKDKLLVFCCDYAQREKVEERLAKNNVDGLIARPFFLSSLIGGIDCVREHTEAEDNYSGLSGLRFLCAEDNDLNAEILESILEMNNASCVIYPNGQELVEAFESVAPGQFDAILMDVQMPVMNGLEATRAIRSGKNPLGKTIPIVAMTANAFASDVQMCLDAGMDAHIAKPLDITALERTLKTLLDANASGGGHLYAAKRRANSPGVKET